MNSAPANLWNMTDNGYTSTIEGYNVTLDFSAKTCFEKVKKEMV